MNVFSDKLHEECGVFGIFSPDGTVDAASCAHYALYALQHRGQASCGIAVNDGAGAFSMEGGDGLVSEVFDRSALSRLASGFAALAHTRYGTPVDEGRESVQPMLVNHARGRLAFSNNGALSNYRELRRELELGGTVLRTNSDAELIADLMIRQWLASPTPEEALSRVMPRLEGAYSMVIMAEKSLIAVRDPHGFRPLCIGRIENTFVFTSETCALDSIGASFVRDVLPGEIVIADENGLRSLPALTGTRPSSLCVFEYVYFARPDSVIGGVSVHAARRQAGAFLAEDHAVDADIVIGVPDSGIDAAIGYAMRSNIPYGLGFIKNKYIGRTFIQPTQAEREDKVRIKLNPIQETVKDRRVVLVDDSIVRGTTCARIIRLVRQAGAREVHVRISSPKFLFPCYFGTDVDSIDALIAPRHSTEEICEIIGADSLGFLSVDRVEHIAKGFSGGFCTGCFTGKYPCACPTEAKERI